MRSVYGLAWRNLKANRVRSLLSVVAVMLGVSVTIAGSVIAESAREGLFQSDEMRVMMEGLVGMLDPAMLFVGVMVMMAGGFLIFNTFGMAITQRRQQIGGLRALGMTRGQVTRVILAEALLLTVTGVALGILASTMLSGVLVTFFQQLAGQKVTLVEASPRLPVVIFAAGMGLLITLLSVVIPARRAARVVPLDALRNPEAAGIERAGRWRTVSGTLLMVALLAYVIVAPPGEWVSYPLDGTLTALFTLLWLVAVILILPAVIGLAARIGKRLMTGTIGRPVTDNLQRGRGRVTLTVMTLAFALLILIGLTGFLRFFLLYGIGSSLQAAQEQDALFISRVDVVNGWGATLARGLDTILLTNEENQAILDATEGRAYTVPSYFVVIPELAFMGDAYFSYMLDPALVRDAQSMFTFSEGDWDTALPIMQAGCGVLVAPGVAARHNATIGDTITITGRDGPIDCTIAGLGMAVAGASIISDTVIDQIDHANPALVFVVPYAGTDLAAFQATLDDLLTRYPLLNLTRITSFMVALDDSLNIINIALNTMLMLAIFAAAFGVVNTMLMSVDERRSEIGLLRAIGMTRAQMRRIILGEAALMGVVGGVVGFLAGLGAVVIIVMTYGLNSIGVAQNLWDAALASIQPAAVMGIIGFIIAPLIAALAAWLPARSILREKPVAAIPRLQ